MIWIMKAMLSIRVAAIAPALAVLCACEGQSHTGAGAVSDVRDTNPDIAEVAVAAGEDAAPPLGTEPHELIWGGHHDSCRDLATKVSTAELKGGRGAIDGDKAIDDRKTIVDEIGIAWRAHPSLEMSAEIPVFNDGVARLVARREGRMSGAPIVVLEVFDSANVGHLLQLGFAGANTESYPATDSLHTSLTYSRANIIEISDKYLTLVEPIDLAPGGIRQIFALNWKRKDNSQQRSEPQDFYPVIECVLELELKQSVTD